MGKFRSVLSSFIFLLLILFNTLNYSWTCWTHGIHYWIHTSFLLLWMDVHHEFVFKAMKAESYLSFRRHRNWTAQFQDEWQKFKRKGKFERTRLKRSLKWQRNRNQWQNCLPFPDWHRRLKEMQVEWSDWGLSFLLSDKRTAIFFTWRSAHQLTNYIRITLDSTYTTS